MPESESELERREPENENETVITGTDQATLLACLGYVCRCVSRVPGTKRKYRFIYRITQAANYNLMQEFYSEAGLAVLAKDFIEASKLVGSWRQRADTAPDGMFVV